MTVQELGKVPRTVSPAASLPLQVVCYQRMHRVRVAPPTRRLNLAASESH